jgi:molecular chaperone GrpE
MKEDKNLDNASKESTEDKGREEQNEPPSDIPEGSKPSSAMDVEVQTYDVKQELEDLTKERDLLKKASETNLRELQYLLADYDNYRKQLERLTDDRIEEKREYIISQLIEIYDDFCKEIAHLKDSGCPTAIVEGFNGTLKNFESILKSEGIREIESLGKLFDPDIHDPVGFEENDDYPEKTIVGVTQKGYMLNNKLVRPSTVILSRKAKNAHIKSDHEEGDNNAEHNPSKRSNHEL